MVPSPPLAVTVPSFSEVGIFLVVALLLLLKLRLLTRLLVGDFSPWHLLGEYRAGKQSVEEREE